MEMTTSEYKEIQKEQLFRKLSKEEKNDEFIAIESKTFFQSVKAEFTKNKRVSFWIDCSCDCSSDGNFWTGLFTFFL